MAAPNPPTPLANLQAAYASVTAALAAYLANPQMNYSIDGVSVDHATYYAQLMARLKELAAIPGVAPELTPRFDVYVSN